MLRFVSVGVLVGMLAGGSAFAAEKAAPKRATAEDLAAALSAKTGKATVKTPTGAAAPAAGALAADAKTERRIVEGAVTGVTKRAISVEYAVTNEGSYEMLLPFAAQMKVEGAPSLAALGRGDKVKVGIEQTYRENEKGERVLLKTEAHVIALVQKAPETLGSEGAATP